MAKALRTPVPSSSIARLFDMESAAKAVSVNPPSDAPELDARAAEAPAMSVVTAAPRSVTSQPGAAAFVNREILLTATADVALTRLVELYRRSTGTKLSTSHVARAMLKGVAHSMQTLEREARRLGPMKLPSNARGNEAERERFEARLADAFVAGIRAAAAFDPGE